MKKKSLLVLMIVAGFSMSLFAQGRPQVPAYLKNYAVTAQYNKQFKGDEPVPQVNIPYAPMNEKIFHNQPIGNTEYDIQSNKSIDSRIYLYPDGTIGATWIRGTGTLADRGTAYNYYDGTAWGTQISRIETVRTGWGSYYPFKNGEIVISHSGATDLVMNKREAKGAGNWSQTYIAAPTGLEMTWPRVVTVGDTIHVLSAHGGDNPYQGVGTAIVYSRSTDGGNNWTHSVLPGMDADAEQLSYSADIYAWAKPKNGTLAFIVGNMWLDVFIMKSTDGGDTWTKTVVFEHPSPFTFDTGVPLDTNYVCDGLVALEMDNSGKLHATFGVVRIMVEEPSTEQFSWFPFTSYLAYWNEDMGTIYDLDMETTEIGIIGWLMDLDNSGIIFDNWTSGAWEQVPTYGNHGLVSQPQITIDDDNNIFVTFAHLNENQFSYAFYRHIWATKSTNGGDDWSEFSELTGGDDYDLIECVYGAMAKNTDDYIHLIFQADGGPGNALQDESHTQWENEIIYMKVLKSDIGVTSYDIHEYNTINSVTVYPNPASDYVNVNIVSPISTNAVITISNILGQQVYAKSIDVKVGSTLVPINVNNLPAGLYMISLQADGKYLNTQKIIIE